MLESLVLYNVLWFLFIFKYLGYYFRGDFGSSYFMFLYFVSKVLKRKNKF